MNVAHTILEQLGGNKFIAMTGSHNFVSDNNGNTLRMKLTKNASGFNYLTIDYTDLDLYNMRFEKVRNTPLHKLRAGEMPFKITDKKEIEGLYNDMLQSIFTKVTGLNTSL